MKIMVMIPTFNERSNIEDIINKIFDLKERELEILVVDDNSPDETWKIVQELAQKNERIHLLLRKTNKGRGTAGKAGYQKCLDMGADIVIEMDADFSHDPKYIPEMLVAIKEFDVVLGSRMIKGGEEQGRSPFRRAVTLFANFYTRYLLGIPVRDCNSGFRCFRREALKGINVDGLKSNGPAIVQEVLFKVSQKKFRIKEIPILFRNRIRGKSKLGFGELLRSYIAITLFRLEN